LSSFIRTATLNGDLFNKSKDLTLSILESSTGEEVIKKVQEDFKKNFNVDNCILELLDGNQINEVESKTEMSFHKGAIHCGSFSKEKMKFLFGDEKVESMAIAVMIVGKDIGLLKLGSYERTKYLGDEDTTFIEYVRDVLEKKFISFNV
jgi:uncharacterized protein YigA (DUF484 family)